MRVYIVMAGLLLLCCATSVSAGLPSADQVLSKCLATYDHAETFQGTVLISSVRGSVRESTSIQVKAEIDGNGIVSRSWFLISTAGAVLSDHTTIREIIVDDGTTVYTIYPDQKQYTTKPHISDRVSGLFRSSIEHLQSISSSLKVSLQRSNGRQVYALTCNLKGSRVKALIDKNSLQLLQMRFERGRGSATDNRMLTVSGQIFNKPIPADTFEWTPPEGYTEKKD